MSAIIRDAMRRAGMKVDDVKDVALSNGDVISLSADDNKIVTVPSIQPADGSKYTDVNALTNKAVIMGLIAQIKRELGGDQSVTIKGPRLKVIAFLKEVGWGSEIHDL